MSNINAYVQTFAGGEFGAAMSARVAIDAYQASCELSENWFMQAQGPMSRRPSLEYIWSLPDSGKAAILKGFEFDVSQNYALPIVEGAMYFILNDGELTLPAITASIANGTFNNFTGWTDNSESGASAEAENGFLKLSSDGAAQARARTTFTVNEANQTHVLAFDVVNGPISVRIGTSAGSDNVVKYTELRTGHHRLEFDPTTAATHHLQFYHDGRRSTKLIDNVEILAGGAAFSIMTPWAEDDLREIFTAQDGDRLWMFHRDYKPRILERRGHRSWSLIQFEPDDGPFDPGPSTLRMTPSDLFGEITITSSANYFEADDQRRLIRITQPGQYVRKVTKTSGVYSDPIKVTGIGVNRAFRGIVSGTFTGTVTLERSVGNLNDFSKVLSFTGTLNTVWNDSFDKDDSPDAAGGSTSDAVFAASGGDVDNKGRLDNQTVYYRWAVLPGDLASGTVAMTLNVNSGSQSGVARILEVISGTQVTAEVIKLFSQAGESDVWDISSWCDSEEYPNVCAFAHGRLWTARRKQLWSSVSDDYFSFQDGTDADRSVQLTLRSKSAEGVRWMRELDFLCVGTRNEEYVIRSTSPSEPIGPTTAEPTLQGEEGGAQVEATVGGDSIVYIHRNLRRVMQFAHNPRALSEDSFVSVDLTRLNPEACEDGIINAVIQQEPERRIFAVTKSGIVKPALFRREEEIVGWQTMSTKGVLEDALVLREATEDAVYFMARRYIGGQWVRMLERMRSEVQLNDEDLVHMDSMLETEIERPELIGITPSSIGQGAVTVLATDDIFEVGDEGKIIWQNGGQIRIDTYVSPTEIEGTVLYPLRGKLNYRTGVYEPAFVPPGRWGMAVPVSSVSGLDHLEGEEVEIWADMAYRGTAIVSGGEVALPGVYSRVFVGLDMPSVWKSLRLAYGAQKGTAVTQTKQVKHMGLVLDRSADSIIMGDKPGSLQKVVKANWGSLFGSTARYFSGEAPAEPFDGASQNDPRIIIASVNPGPCTIKALIPNIQVNDR